ncbi:MAG: alpha/beta fold hydrolase [Sandaracinus sp.]|nr:alpha/beta fold hydrolase [Sandaracinus sp.]MCB9615985.1 alpha/beta fold hydrolase [Sandaracinus sp.]MCB9621854.1 alpha/beta fold hydrolase [Sandaracinus sp.]MCB9630747.1 alpha/beta fold hydrolase [Sandaracinus sp.]
MRPQTRTALESLGFRVSDHAEGETLGGEEDELELVEYEIDVSTDADGEETGVPIVKLQPPAGLLSSNIRSRERLVFKNAHVNRVSEWLCAKDIQLNPYLDSDAGGVPRPTLRKLDRDSGTFLRDNGRIAADAVVVVHGTFSRGDVLWKSPLATTILAATERNPATQVYAFEYPSLSCSPFMSAAHLARFLPQRGKRLVFIGHSQGGLVIRWLLESMRRDLLGCSRAILVGAPLHGTSLASARDLRAVVDHVANLSKFFERSATVAAFVVPYFAFVASAFAFTRKLIKGAAVASPLIDAAIASVPSISAMQPGPSNGELEALSSIVSGFGETPDYFFVTASYSVNGPFWKHMANMQGYVRGRLAKLVFGEEDNDLVVDVRSMSVRPQSAERVLHKDGLHHCNYFEDVDVLNWIGALV